MRTTVKNAHTIYKNTYNAQSKTLTIIFDWWNKSLFKVSFVELRFQMYDIDKNSQFTRVITLKIINPNLSTKRTISHQSTQTWIDKVLLLNISLAQYIHILCCLMIRKHPISCETGTKKKKEKRRWERENARCRTIERYLSICYVWQSVATASCTVQTSKGIKITLSIFAIAERASSTAFFPIGYSGKITCRTGNVLWFSDQFMSPRRERNLESVSLGPVGKTSLHISYMDVYNCASILASSLFLFSLLAFFVRFSTFKPTLITVRVSCHHLKSVKLALQLQSLILWQVYWMYFFLEWRWVKIKHVWCWNAN